MARDRIGYFGDGASYDLGLRNPAAISGRTARQSKETAVNRQIAKARLAARPLALAAVLLGLTACAATGPKASAPLRLIDVHTHMMIENITPDAEVALLMKLSPGTISHYRREWEQAHAKLLPTRGSIHDMGPTLTHKDIILRKLIFQGKSVEAVCRETDHSPEAVLRYTTNFKQVLLCQARGFDVAQTSFATKLSHRLIEEHLALIAEYRTQYANLPGGGNYQLETLLKKLDQPTQKKHTPTPP